MIDLTPETGLLHSCFNQNLDTRTALCEWIDNALDAGAKCIRITFGPSRKGKPRWVSVEDDGTGTDDLAALARLGKHRKQRGTKRGVYGVGAKDAAFYFGDERSRFTIESIHGGRARRLVVDWRDIIDSGQWSVADPSDRPADPTSPTGTKVMVAPVERRIPDGQAWSKLLDDLGYFYTPALKKRVQILVKPKRKTSDYVPLREWRLPPLQPDHVDTRVEVAGGGARVYAGIVAEGYANTRPGLTYHHGDRVIIPACALGCGRFSTTRIAGFVDFDDRWSRYKNKDGIKNAEPLYEAVEGVLTPLLVRAQEQGSQLASAALAEEVTGLINNSINDAKARRGKGKRRGGVPPRGTPVRHRDATRKQRGTTMPSGRYGSVRVEFGHLGSGSGAGLMQSNGIVVLNLDCPAVLSAQQEPSNTLAVASFACSVIASDYVIRGDAATLRLNLRTEEESLDDVARFSAVLGELLSAAARIDGRAVLAEAAE